MQGSSPPDQTLQTTSLNFSGSRVHKALSWNHAHSSMLFLLPRMPFLNLKITTWFIAIDNVCVFPKFVFWNLTPNVMDLEMGLLGGD